MNFENHPSTKAIVLAAKNKLKDGINKKRGLNINEYGLKKAKTKLLKRGYTTK